jgi:DNA-binding PadR family transcriptional regulator
LENYGFIEKNVYREKPPRVEYQISDSGIQLFPLIEAICLYGEKFLENEHIQRVNDLKPKRKTTKSKSKSTEDLEIIEENGLKFVKVTHMIKSLPKTQKKQRAIISEHKDLIVAQDASEIEIEIAPAKQSNLEDKQDLIKTPKTKVEKKSSSKKTKSENQANSLLDQKPNEIIQLSLF